MWFLWISYVGRFEKYGNQRRVNESVIDLTVVSLPPDSATHGIETHVDSRVDEPVEIDKDDVEDVEPGEQLTISEPPVRRLQVSIIHNSVSCIGLCVGSWWGRAGMLLGDRIS